MPSLVTRNPLTGGRGEGNGKGGPQAHPAGTRQRPSGDQGSRHPAWGWGRGPTTAADDRGHRDTACAGVGMDVRGQQGRQRRRPLMGVIPSAPAAGARRSRPAARRTLSAVPHGIHSRAVPSHFQSTPDNCDQRFRHHLAGGTTAGRQRVQPSEQRRRAVENERILAPVSGPCSSRGMLTTDYCHRYPAR